VSEIVIAGVGVEAQDFQHKFNTLQHFAIISYLEGCNILIVLNQHIRHHVDSLSRLSSFDLGMYHLDIRLEHVMIQSEVMQRVAAFAAKLKQLKDGGWWTFIIQGVLHMRQPVAEVLCILEI
jgi:hypothetical protein